MTAAFDKRITPARPDLAADYLRGVVEAQAYLPGCEMLVVEEMLPLFPQPNREGPIDTHALYGESVVVYEIDEEGWAWGQLKADGYVGYLPADGLREPVAAPNRKVSAPRTLVYPGPSMKLPPWGAFQGWAMSGADIWRGSKKRRPISSQSPSAFSMRPTFGAARPSAASIARDLSRSRSAPAASTPRATPT